MTTLRQWCDKQTWQSQLWIKTPWVIACIGRLPMYSGEPIGIWIGVKRKPPIENLDGYPTAVLSRGRYSEKLFVRKWSLMHYPKNEYPTAPAWVSDDDERL